MIGPEQRFEARKVQDIHAALFYIGVLDGADGVDGRYGIHTVQRAESLPEGTDCLNYIFGEGANALTLGDFISISHKVSEPRPGAIALYGNEFTPSHIGIVTKRRTVISKWGSMHAYEHPPKHTIDYGQIEYWMPPPAFLRVIKRTMQDRVFASLI